MVLKMHFIIQTTSLLNYILFLFKDEYQSPIQSMANFPLNLKVNLTNGLGKEVYKHKSELIKTFASFIILKSSDKTQVLLHVWVSKQSAI